MLRSAARRAREAQGHPAAADEKAPEAAAAALAAAPAPPPVEKRRRVTRAEEREREEIRPGRSSREKAATTRGSVGWTNRTARHAAPTS